MDLAEEVYRVTAIFPQHDTQYPLATRFGFASPECPHTDELIVRTSKRISGLLEK